MDDLAWKVKKSKKTAWALFIQAQSDYNRFFKILQIAEQHHRRTRLFLKTTSQKPARTERAAHASRTIPKHPWHIIDRK